MPVLESVRVLDLTGRQGMLCAQILADLGADVIQIEPPGGAAGRGVGPFFGDIVDPEGSLSWWGRTPRGKRSIVLDIAAERDRPTLMRLIEAADVLVESEPLGRLERLGLDDAALEVVNPALIHVSMTGYGRTGPKAGWAWTDLTLMAAGGPLVLAGDDDRAPVRVERTAGGCARTTAPPPRRRPASWLQLRSRLGIRASASRPILPRKRR